MLLLILHPFPWLKPRCFSKDWDVTEYGVCELIDIVSEIPDTTICLSQQDNEMVICIPKRGMWLKFAERKLSVSVVILTWNHTRDALSHSFSVIPEDSMESAAWKLLCQAVDPSVLRVGKPLVKKKTRLFFQNSL